MSSYKFLLTPPPRVIVDIECLFDVYTAVLDRHEKEFGNRLPPTWTGTEFPILRNVSTKYGKRISAYFKEPGFFDNIPIEHYALRGLFRMETLGFDVYIVISTAASYLPACQEQQNWFMKRFPESWHSRLIVCRDKSLLTADYLIDVQPNPLESLDAFRKRGNTGAARPSAIQKPTWQLILFDRPFNQKPTVPIHGRFSGWKTWTCCFGNVLNLSLRATIPSFAHGSQNSLDQDRLYIFPHEHINTVLGDQVRAILDDGIVDVNLLDFDADGYVCDNHKGQNDEIHNAIQVTYPLHQQIHPLPANLAPPVQRAIALKFYGGMRRIFIRLTEIEQTRPFFKETLRNHDPHAAPLAFRKLNFEEVVPLTDSDHVKLFAFQMGQTMGLFDGVDLFTKDDIVRAYPVLEPFIRRNREESVARAGALNEFKEAILSRTQQMAVKVGPHETALLQVSPAFLAAVRAGTAAWTPLLEQSNGMILDFKDLSIVAFPPTHQNAHDKTVVSWPKDPSGPSSDAAVLPSELSISVGRESHGHIICADRIDFDTPACRLVAQEIAKLTNVKSWPWWSTYFFFEVQDERLVLVAARSKFSHLFFSKERLEKLREEMGLVQPIATPSSSESSSSGASDE